MRQSPWKRNSTLLQWLRCCLFSFCSYFTWQQIFLWLCFTSLWSFFGFSVVIWHLSMVVFAVVFVFTFVLCGHFSAFWWFTTLCGCFLIFLLFFHVSWWSSFILLLFLWLFGVLFHLFVVVLCLVLVIFNHFVVDLCLSAFIFQRFVVLRHCDNLSSFCSFTPHRGYSPGALRNGTSSPSLDGGQSDHGPIWPHLTPSDPTPLVHPVMWHYDSWCVNLTLTDQV